MPPPGETTQNNEDEQQPLLTDNFSKAKSNSDVDKSQSKDKKDESSDKIGVYDSAFFMVAGSIGGEVVAMPYAMSRLGIVYGSLAILVVAILAYISNMMYLKVKDTVPGNHKSIYELAYCLSGRAAIFVVCAIQYMLVFTDMILYYIIIGDTFSQLFHQYFIHDTDGKTISEKKNDLKVEPMHAQILGEKAFHILFIGGILMSVIFMRKLRDFKVIAYLFFVASLLLVSLMGLELWMNGTHGDETLESLQDIRIDYHLITAFNIIFQAFCAQFIVFPTYLEMKNRSNQRFSSASALAFFLDTLIFVLIGI